MRRSSSWLPFEIEVLLAEFDDRGAESTLALLKRRILNNEVVKCKSKSQSCLVKPMIGNHELVMTGRQFATFEIVLDYRVGLR